MVKKTLARLKRRLATILPYWPKAVLALALVGLLILGFKTLPPLFRSVSRLLPVPLAATNGRTNVLILGKGGAGHETPELTDTIIFFSYHHPSGKSLMLSLPRDIWVDSLRAKLNTAYYYGNQKQTGAGLILASAAVEEIIDQPVHYTLVVDFNAFVNLIDLLGGVDIEVKQAFDDFKYPIPGKENVKPIADRYEHLHFDQGLQTMNGQIALKYVRSRNAEGPEGTDYARAARQQQVILSVQKKIISQPQKLLQLIKLLSSSVDTDIKNGALTGFIKLAPKFNRALLTTATLNDDLLINPPASQYDNQWVLIGKDSSWDQVQTYVASLLTP